MTHTTTINATVGWLPVDLNDELRITWPGAGGRSVPIGMLAELFADDGRWQALQRLLGEDTMTEYQLIDAETDNPIGPANDAAVRASLKAEPTGFILIDSDGDPVDVSIQCDKRQVYVR